MKVQAAAAALSLAFACLASADKAAHGKRELHTPRGDQTFSLTQVRNEDFKGINVPAAMIQAHIKFDTPLTDGLKNAIRVNADLNAMFKQLLHQDDGSETGTAQAQPATRFDSEYVIPVDIGTPPQTIPLNLDTGSSDLWTFSTDTSTQHVRNQVLYSPDTSTSHQRLQGESWKIKYGDNSSASGIVYTDRVSIGGIVAEKQAIESAVEVSSAIAGDSFSSGILGMAAGSANTVRPTKQKTFFDNIRDDLKQPLFTANLQRQRPGNYNFGFINESEYTGEIQYAASDKSTPFFKITVSGYQVGKSDYMARSFNGIVDTGTSLLLVPGNVVNDYYKNVPNVGYDGNSKNLVFPCDADLPDFVFGIGSYRGVVPGHYIRYGQATENICYGGIQSSDDIGFAVLGDVMLKAQFVVFNGDPQGPRVGFANKPLDPE